MVASALGSGVAERRSVFEVFARRLPVGRAYGVVAGMNRVIDAIERFRFSDSAIDYLVGAGVVEQGPMTDWLAAYRFEGDVTGYADGELFFPYSPVLTIEGGFAECVVLETVLLSVLNHDCAIAGAAARVTDAASGRMLIDGGSRRTDPRRGGRFGPSGPRRRVRHDFQPRSWAPLRNSNRWHDGPRVHPGPRDRTTCVCCSAGCARRSFDVPG